MGEHGTLSMTQALAHSCNVYYGELAAALGKDKLQAAADRLGLNGTPAATAILPARPSICRTRTKAASPGPGSDNIPTRSPPCSFCASWA